MADSVRSFWTGPLTGNELDEYLRRGQQTVAGVPVSHANAFTFSAVFDAVNQISSDIAKLPLNLMKRRADGGSDLYTESKLYRILKYQPNQEMGSMVFRRALFAHALTWGNGFAEIERDGLGRPSALWLITPDRMTIERDGQGNLQYRVRNYSQSDTRCAPADILHIPGPSFDGTCGYDVINLARQAIGLALASERFGAAFFGNGATFGGILSTDLNLSEEEAKAMRAVVESIHQGPDRAHKLAVLWGGMKYTSTGVAPNAAQMNELRARQVEEVARFFNMPVHKLKNLDRATNNNIEQQSLEYYTGCLLNWVTLGEEEYNRKLISPLEAKQQFIKHNVNAFMRGDSIARAAFYSAMLDRGVFNADMVLELEDMNPQPNGQGKMFLVQGAMQPKDMIPKLLQSQIDKNTAPPPAPPPPPAAHGDTPPPDPAAARALELLSERADLAEAAALEARTAIQIERDARITAEATASLSAEDRTAAVAREQAAIEQAGALTLVASEAKRDLEIARQQFETERTAREAAQVEAEQARLAQVEAETIARAETEAATEARQREAEAVASVGAATDAAAQASEARMASEQLLASEQAARNAAEVVAQGEITAAVERAIAAESAATEQQARAAEEVQSLRETMAAIATERDQAVVVANLANRDMAITQTARTEAETRAAAHQQAASDAETALTAAKLADADASALIISAHRSLMVHVMRGAIERESDRAQRHQQTPDKLRAWMATWYDNHAELMTAALLPAVTVHLAWIRSTVAPGDVVRRLVAEHIEESKRQLDAVIDGDAGALARNLAQLLRRWETERVSIVADRLMQEEIDYVKRRVAA